MSSREGDHVRLKDEMASGYEPIDEQHRALLDRVDEAVAAARSGDCAATQRALVALGDLLVSHFGVEEEAMSELLYPDRARHKTAHDLFMQDFAQLEAELGKRGLTPLALTWLETRLPEWLRFHIQVNDAPLGRYLERRGRTAPATRNSKSRVC